jgi:uncharacterized protein (DUF4213/DUF364 family)
MTIIDRLLAGLPEGAVRDVRVGAFWTAVVVETGGDRRYGLASTPHSEEHHHRSEPAVPGAGRLAERSARDLAGLAHSESLMEAAIGVAAINALLPLSPEQWVDFNAEEVIARHGAGKNVALVGHFPFVPRLQEAVGSLRVLELQPGSGDLPSEAAPDVIPQADVVAITGTTLINHTLEGLLALCRPEALILVLGPSTPLSPILFDYGIHILSGAVVEDPEAVLRAVSQGANFRQVHRQGVRLVTIQTERMN